MFLCTFIIFKSPFSWKSVLAVTIEITNKDGISKYNQILFNHQLEYSKVLQLACRESLLFTFHIYENGFL